MKKIFILGLLLTPIMAHAAKTADDHPVSVGPSAVPWGGTPVVATARAPYATATEETGDTTNVVSASYVKGAYNDTIAAVNRLSIDMSGKRVSAVTTWGSDTTTKVPLVNQ